MAQEFIIGRSANSPVQIPEDKVQVSREHVKITINDNNQWELKDLGKPNGTYIKDRDGYFQRVSQKIITPDTIIRLGSGGHNSFAFMAHRAIDRTGGYTYELNRLKATLSELTEEEDRLTERNARNMNIVKASAPTAMLLSMLVPVIVPAAKEDANLNLWISRILMGSAPFIVGLFFGINTTGMRALKQKRARLLVCPKCGYPISEFDIQNMRCSRCNAC